MADRVEIEIPGIGLIEAKNAATEATLQEILKALKGIEDNTEEEAKNSKKSGNAGAGAAGAAGMAAGLGAAASAAAAMGASLGLAGKAAAAMGKAVGLAGKGVGFGAGVAVAGLQNVSRAALSTSLSLMSLGHTAINLANDLAGMGDKISNAVNLTSNALRSLPGIFGAIGGLVGAAFTAAVGSAERMVGAYQTAASVGATFGGNLNSLNAAASAAGMTMENFAKLLANNANSLVYLGGTTDGGARRFADLSKTMRNSQIGSELSRMGFTTEQVNSGMAEFVGMIGRTGAIQNMTTQDIAKSSGAYLKDLDALRRLTGESAAQQKAANDKLMADAQFRAAMLGKDAETQKAMMAYINSLPENLRDGAKEMLATGQVTSEAGIAFAAALPKAAGEAMSYGRDLKAGGKLTMDQSLRARNNLIEESKVRQDLLKDQAMYNKELQPTLLGVMDAAASSQKSYAELQREQAKAAKEKNLAQAVEDFRKRIAEISNTFTALLANSGMFDLFAQVFENVVSIVSTFVIPAIKALFGAIQAVIPPIIDTLVPIINDYVIPAFQILGEWISTAVVPIFQKVGAILTDLFAPAIESGVNVVEDIFEPALYAISDFIEDNLEPIMLVLGAAIASTLIPAILKQAATLLLTNAPMLLLVGAVTGAWTIMKKFGVDLTVVGDALRWTGSWIETFFLQIKKGFYTFLDSLPMVNMTKELEEVNQQIKDNEKDREKIEKDIADRRKANLEAEAAKEAERAARDEGRAKARDAREQQALERKMKREMGAIDDKEKREKEAAGGVDMTSPTAMLESFSRQQNGFFAERIDGARQEQKVRLETAAANKQMAEAEQKYAQAKTAEEKKAALEEIVAVQKRINAIQEGNKEISRPGAAQAPSVAPTKLPAGSQVTGLGAVAAHFEAGGKAGTVSTGHGDFGGKSYGAFQLSSKTGDVQKFLDKSGYAAQFKGMEVGSKEFDAKWKELGATKEFAQAQAAHAKTTHYDPQMQKLSKAGLDMSGRGAGVQEAIMSTANQYGANTDVIMKALKDKDTSKMSDKDIINAIQDYKAETVKTRFKSSSAAVQAGVAKRIEQERAMLLGVDGGAVQADVRKADQAKEQKGKPPESKPAKETTPKLDPKLANDWAYSVFVGKNSMSQVPKPYLDEVGKILAKPPANWVSAPKTPEAKVETAQTEQGKPPQQKPVEEVKPKLGGKAVQNWAYAVFEGKITLGQVPQMYRDQVAEVLKNPPADWTKSPGEAKPAKPLGAESESAQAATPTNEEFKINGKQVSKEEFDAYMKANPQAAKMMDMAKQMSGGNGPSVDLMKSMGGILPVGSDLPAESILGKETFATTFDPLSDTSLDAIAPMAESKLGSTDALTSAEGFKQTMSEDAATKMAEEQKARKAMFDMMGRTDVEGSVMQRAGRAGGAGGGEKAKDPVELLNSKLEQLIMINQNIANLNSDQLRVQKNFNTGDVYNSAG